MHYDPYAGKPLSIEFRRLGSSGPVWALEFIFVFTNLFVAVITLTLQIQAPAVG